MKSSKATRRLPIRTTFGSNTTWSRSTEYFSAAKSISRSLICSAAFCAAMPFRSEPDEAAVAEVFGTLAVVVAVIFTRSRSTWKQSATTCATLVLRPCPISVPPWFRWIEPSL